MIHLQLLCNGGRLCVGLLLLLLLLRLHQLLLQPVLLPPERGDLVRRLLVLLEEGLVLRSAPLPVGGGAGGLLGLQPQPLGLRGQLGVLGFKAVDLVADLRWEGKMTFLIYEIGTYCGVIAITK